MSTTRERDDVAMSAEWYYVGHYGQLGPLTLEQLEELARDGVVTPETHVWRHGMADWKAASEVDELRSAVPQPLPRPPELRSAMPPGPPPLRTGPAMAGSALAASSSMGVAQLNWDSLSRSMPVSDKSRVVAGLLNLIPGIGRFYLGYSAHGALQLFLAIFGCGIGWVWSIIDGVYIMSGGVKMDGYGRRLE